MAAPVNWLLPLMLAVAAAAASAQPAPPARVSTVTGQSRTLLPDGRVLIVGGADSRGPRADLSVQDAASGTVMRMQAPGLEPRAWHTATVLPDGRVLILGGVGRRSEVSPSAQILDPATGRVSPVHATFAPRARHTATLLTDGTVLIVGGSDTHGLVPTAERWDPATGATSRVHAELLTPRADHEALLTSEGGVLIKGGRGADGDPAPDEAFNPEAGAFAPAPPGDVPVAGAALTGSVPVHGDADVPLDARLALRFSAPLLSPSVTSGTVRLEGPAGPVEAEVIAAEGGRLVFVHPTVALGSSTAYLVHIDGVVDASGQVLPFGSVAFMTTGARTDAGSDVSDEVWRPTAEHHRGNWRLGQPESPWSRLPALRAAPGVTAVSGQVLALNGRPLADVTLAIGDRNVTSDRTGRFLLLFPSSGSQTLLIDGRTASDAGRRFGVFHARLWVREGETNVLPFAIWLPRTDTAHAVRLSGPLDRDLVVTTPLIPGLEVHIPKGSIVRDHEGRPATEVSITPIPVDRPPFPLPTGVSVPVYFTIQPGGGFIESPGKPWPEGARVVYPNYTYERPGTRLNFWNYDPEERGWHVYGMGAVDPAGIQVMPDRGVVLYRFTGTMINYGLTPPGPYPPPGWWPWGDPIDPSSGLFVLSKTDLYLPDVIPLALTRTYRQNDTASRPFGIGATHPYAMFLWSAQQYQEVDLILPDGGRVHYVRISPGTGFSDAEFEHTSSPTPFQKSRIKYNTSRTTWDLTLKDGTVYVFGDTAPLQEIRDRYGNRVTLKWSSQNGLGQGIGKLLRVTSPHTRFLEFTYDGSDRITEAKDNSGRTVGYEYDASGRLWKVTDANGGVTEYTYDASHRMVTIEDARGIVYLTNEYDTNGRVVRQTQADNTTYEMAYTLDGSGRVAQADLTNPRGQAERLTFNTSGYVTTHVQAVGTSLERTTTFTRQSGTNLLTSVTDPLSRQTDYSYDTMGNVTSVTRLAGTMDALTTSMTYEPTFNLVASLTDPLSQVRTFTYDSLGRLTAATDPLTNQTTFTYNEAGQVLTITTPANETTLLAYPFGDLASVTTPLGHVEQRFVDTAGRIVQYTDASGARTRFEYNPLNQVTKIIDPLGGETTFTYDGNGNLLTLTDARGKTTTWTYDALDRVATRTDPLNRQETFAYDAKGNLVEWTDRKGQVTSYAYDPLDRQTLVGFGTAGSPPAYESTIETTYDAGDRVVEIDDSAGGTITRDYDLLDRVIEETTPEGTVTYSYDAADRRTAMGVSGQTGVSYSYDAADRLTEVAQGSAAVTIAYDSANRRTSLTLPNGVVIAYGYDADARLTGLTYTHGQTTLGTLTYSYDAAGRRTEVGGTWARTNLPATLASAIYDDANQVATWEATGFTYDENGNLTGDGVRSYTWNARNQLTALSGPVSGSFAYDGFGRRRTKTVGGTTTGFLYDGLNPVQELAGGLPAASLVTGLGIDEYFTRTDGTGARHFLADALGSTVALGDGSGAVQTEYSYEPYGGLTTSGAASGNAFTFTGREADGTGLFFYRARYYHPRLQRFVSEDPIGLAAGANVYSYVLNQPTRYTDPLGLKPSPWFGGSGGGGAGGAGGGGGDTGGGGGPGPDPDKRRNNCPPGPKPGDLPHPWDWLAYGVEEGHHFTSASWIAMSGAGVMVAGGAATVVLAGAGPAGWAAIPFTTLPVMAAGMGTNMWGNDLLINEFNNLTGSDVAGPGDFLPFPRLPHCH